LIGAELLDTLTRGNVPQVKTVVASVAVALAAYQLLLIAFGYGRLRAPFLGAGAASGAHRASGDAIVVLVLIVAAMCLAHWGFGEHAGFHAVTGTALVVVFALKIVVVRWWHAASPLLPVLGTSVFVLLAATWAGSAAELL